MEVLIYVVGHKNHKEEFIMRNRKRILAGMVVLVLVLVLGGCETVSFAETEGALEILQAATDLLALQGGRITVGELVSGLKDRFPGLSLGQIHGGGISISYQGRDFSIRCEFDRGGATIYTVRASSIVTSISSVGERIEGEQDGQ